MEKALKLKNGTIIYVNEIKNLIINGEEKEFNK